MPELKNSIFHDWPTYTVALGPLELVILPQIGGRIIGLNWRGQDLAFQQPERLGTVPEIACIDDIAACKAEMGFPLWGGDKTWLAPQESWLDGKPFLDLDSGVYLFEVLQRNGQALEVRLLSPICRESDTQIVRTIRLAAQNTSWPSAEQPSTSQIVCWQVQHELHNRNEEPIHWSIWDVSMLRRPAELYLPTKPNSQFAGGIRTYEHEGESLALRATVLQDIGANVAKIDCQQDRAAFKYGSDAHEGWLLGIFPNSDQTGYIAHLKCFETLINADYAHKCSTEVYSSAQYPYVEMEIHAPRQTLEPGHKISLLETCYLLDLPTKPSNGAEVRSLVAQLSKIIPPQ